MNSTKIKLTPYALTLSITLFLMISSCKKEAVPLKPMDGAVENEIQSSSTGSIVVPSGGSIQAAVDAATPGTRILVQPGTYTEAVTVNKPGIQIIGSDEDGGVILVNPGTANNGITVRDLGDGFVLKHVTIKNFLRNGVFIIRADNFVLTHVTTIDNGAYGLFPIFSNNGTIEHCIASGHNDTGIYIGQSSNITMSHNKVFENVNGIEIENCTHIRAVQNHCYNNTAGILVVLLPGLTSKISSDILLDNNQVNDNNHVNFALPGGFEAFVPSGSGILLVGSDDVLVKNNKVRDNNFTGIANVSSLILGAIAGIPPAAFADIEPNPDRVKIQGNKLMNNGGNPPAGLPLPGVDLLWDGSGTGNCWSGNLYASLFPSALPVCDN